jgi:hypothetical protein
MNNLTASCAETDAATLLAERLNRDCFCIGTDVPELRRKLDQLIAGYGVHQPLAESHPHLFSTAPVFIAAAQMQAMLAVIAAIESVVATAQWTARVLAQAPDIARHQPMTRGVFMGYDFHIDGSGARLIEINTNAGGALLNLAMAHAQHACCAEMLNVFAGGGEPRTAEAGIIAMFRDEWRLARGDRPLRRIAIVDSQPERQYLYPEFLMFQRLLAAHGIEVLVLDPAQVALRDGRLQHADFDIDLVYNRLTDFYFEEPAHAHLRKAYLGDAAVFSPHPRAHALYANKHNLELLTNADTLRSWQIPESTIATLMRGIPRTVDVATFDAATLWQERAGWFFKPASGFGSRGSYRGDKITHKVFDQIRAGDYVAQALVPPSARSIEVESGRSELKLDLRHYVYDGRLLLSAARLYQGQTTNFRTCGGGFAPVYQVPAGAEAAVNAVAGPGSCGIRPTSNCSTAAASN